MMQTLSNESISWTMLIASYQNHVIHASVYVTIICLSLKSSTSLLVPGAVDDDDAPLPFVTYVWIALHYICTGLSALALKGEVAYMVKRSRLPPGDPGFPIMGHLPLFILLKDRESFWRGYLQKYGSICTLNTMMVPIVLVTEDEDVLWAMAQERKGKTRAFFLPHFVSLLGEESIMVKSGDEHRRLRKAFEPAFTPLAIRDYAGSIDKMAQEQLVKWCDSGEFQQPREWALLAMRIFFICAFGEANEERMAKLAFLFENWVKGFRAPIPIACIPPLSTAHYYKGELGNVLKEMIAEFKAKNSPNSLTAKTSVMGRLCYAVDEEGRMPTEKQLIDNLRIFLFAGFDTTKASFCAILHFLKQNPELEVHLVEECKSFQHESLDIDRLKHEAPILNAVLAESWRLMAPLANHSTITNEDLKYKGYIIPKGTFIAIDIRAHNILNNARFPRAAEFCYQRWLPENHPLYDPAVANKEEIDYNVMNTKFRSFNMGPHMCLGGHFAKMEVRIVITRLFQSYGVEIRNGSVSNFPLKQLLNEFILTKREA